MTEEIVEPSLGLRMRKKLETRHAIRRAALQLALDDGLENLTIEAIASAANISQRTFFNYFDRKEDALVTNADEAAAALRPLIVARPAHESPLHAIRVVITENDPFQLLNADRDQALARQTLIQAHPALMARQMARFALMEQAFASAVAERLGVDPDSDLRPALTAGVAAAALRVAIRHWTFDSTTDLPDLLIASFDALENGLLAAEVDSG